MTRFAPDRVVTTSSIKSELVYVITAGEDVTASIDRDAKFGALMYIVGSLIHPAWN
jgi:hypothetical protein